jgi:pimeloyl-ACP methyl ester carboxylesterase
MFGRSKNPPENFNLGLSSDAMSTEEKFNQEWIRTLEKKSKRRRRLAVKMSATAIALSSISSAYWADVQENRAEQEAAHISINVIGEAKENDNSHKATIFIDGFNSYDADFLAGNMGPAAQQVADGELWSLSYNNAILNRDKIYNTVIDFAEERDIKSISIDGYSMGGIIGTEAAADIVEHSDLPVDTLMMVSTPDGREGVQKYQQNEIDFMQWLTEWVPGAIDSTWFRFVGEVYFYRDNYTKWDYKDWTNIPENLQITADNFDAFTRAVNNTSERMDDPRATSLQLLSQQAYKVDRFDMLKELETISKQRDEKQMPTLLYLGSDTPTVVDDTVSAANFATYAEQTNIDYYSFIVPGAVHSHYFDTPEAYTLAYSEARGPVKQSLETEAGRRSILLFANSSNPNSLFMK